MSGEAVDAPATASRQSVGSLSTRYHGLDKNVWIDLVDLASKEEPLSLGLGFPDFAAPRHVVQFFQDVSGDTDVFLNQYTRSHGHPHLATAVAKLYSKLLSRVIDPLKEVVITVGADEALFCAIMSNVNPGDEVIVIEPFYDAYAPMIKIAGGTPRFIPLRPRHLEGEKHAKEFVLDDAELESSFNRRTKAIIVNTPHNPLGKVFTEHELKKIADLCVRWNSLAIMDEVYEHMVFTGQSHVRMASLPGMWERTVNVGSGGKTFNVTGWKIGWAYGPANLIHNLQVAHQNCVYTCCTPVQEAVARAIDFECDRFDSPDCYFSSIAVELEKKRNLAVHVFTGGGLMPIVPEGTCFMLADWSSLAPKLKGKLKDETDPHADYRFVKWMTKAHKLQCIPASAFYSDEHKSLGEDYVRICFIKEDCTLMKAGHILEKLRISLENSHY